MTARFSVNPGRTRGHRPRLQEVECPRITVSSPESEGSRHRVAQAASKVGSIHPRATPEASVWLDRGTYLRAAHRSRAAVCCRGTLSQNSLWSGRPTIQRRYATGPRLSTDHRQATPAHELCESGDRL